jgi:hypothetical protein
VTEGAIVLHRRSGRRHTARVDELDEEDLEDAAGQVQRAFAARAQLAGLAKQADLLDARLARAATLELEREIGLGRGARTHAYIHLAGGTRSTIAVSPGALDVVAALDGERTLREVIRIAGKSADGAILRRQALTACRELLELGALKFS